MDKGSFSRREFARLVMAGSAAAFPYGTYLEGRSLPLPPAPAVPDEAFWRSVRQQFLMPRNVTVLCAANLCPTPAPVIEALLDATRDIDKDPGAENRRKWVAGRQASDLVHSRRVSQRRAGGDSHNPHLRGKQPRLEWH